MEEAKRALSDAQASRANVLRAELRQAAFHCIHNAGPINKILAEGTIEPTTFRIIDENRVRAAIEQSAAALAQNTVQVNVSTQNRLKAHIDRLERDLAQTRIQNLALQETNISLQSTLEANEEKYNKLLTEQLSAAELREELEKIESFDVEVLNQQMFPTPKKPAPMPRDGTIVGGGNLFGGQELEHNKLKY